MARKWVKLWVSESLRGTIRFDLTPAERGVWYDLLALAGDCRQEGLIAPGETQAYPLRWIAGTLNISTSLLDRTLEKCKTLSRIDVNGTGIRILNWNRYQSEYERQKPFRDKKVTKKLPAKLLIEGEGEGEGEGDIYIYLFNLWNGLKIISHKKLTGDMKRAIDGAKKDYSQEEIGLAMQNYAVIVKGNEYYFSHKWTLAEFLSRRHSNNIERFLDLEIAKSNFKAEEGKSGADRQSSRQLTPRQSYTRPEDA